MIVLSTAMKVTALYRYAIKGLRGDPLERVPFLGPGETFPDDRRFALFKEESSRKVFDPENPEWLHKENFLCAFSAPELMATFESRYRIVESEDGGRATKRELALSDRASGDDGGSTGLGPTDLSTAEGRDEVSAYFSKACGESVRLVCKQSRNDDDEKHTHQFGNTRSGVRERGDTRTVHIVNAATVRQVSERIGVPLTTRRFRPNIVVDGCWEPWEEFELVGRSVACEESGLTFDVISKTVRCEGISVDPHCTDDVGTLDMPKLLQEHFPEHGPYLGVYAVVREGGSLSVGDEFAVLDSPTPSPSS